MQHDLDVDEVTVPPRLAELNDHALTVSRRQLLVALLRPWAAMGLFAAAALVGWWQAAVPIVALIFVTNVVVLHDLLHSNLGLSRRANDALVGIFGLLHLNSGHALVETHRRHHRVYPAPDDPEAYVDGWPIWRVLLEGPVYRFRLWRWALRQGGRAVGVIRCEIAMYVGVWLVAIGWGSELPAFRLYVATTELGLWIFPAIGVAGVHDRSGTGRLQRTRTLHHPLARFGMFGMQYHLEHHLYPRVPACRLGEIADAVEPWLLEHDASVRGRPCRRWYSPDGPSDSKGNRVERFMAGSGDRWPGRGGPHGAGPVGQGRRALR